MTENGFENSGLIHHELRNGMSFFKVVWRGENVRHIGSLYVNNSVWKLSAGQLLFYSLANLTGHEDEKVGLENFELLKVLGTGGKQA